jgi:hypothetical protein
VPRLLTATLIALVTASATAAPSIPEILPASTFFAVHTPSTQDLRESFERSPMGALWEEPSVQSFLRPLTDQIRERLGDQGGDPVLSLDEFWDLFPGQITVGLLRITALAKGPDVAPFFAAETSRPERVREIVDEILTRAGATQSRDTYTVQDVTVDRNTLRLAAPADDTEDPYATDSLPGVMQEQTAVLHTAVVDGIIVIALDESLETLIQNLRGGGDGGLANSAVARRLAEMAGQPEHHLMMHMGFAPLDQFLRGTPGPEDVDLPALGVGDFGAFGLWVNSTPEAGDAWAALSVNPNPRGLGRLMRHAGPSDFDALDWVPSDVESVSAIGYDFGAGLREIRQILRAVSPSLDTVISGGLMTANQTLGIDIENDFLYALGRDMVSYTFSSSAGGGGSPINVMVIGLANPEGLETVLARLAQPAVVGTTQVTGGAQMLEAKEFLGQTYYSPPAVFSDPSAAETQPGLAVLADRLAFASSVSELQRVIAASQGQIEEPLRQSDLWPRIETIQMPGASGLAYQDDAAVMAGLVEALQQMAVFFMMMPQFSPPVDLMSAPPREVFERHLTHTVSTSKMSAEGFVSHSHTPHHR